MRLSIIIPVYNAEKYIRKCIESIFSNLENSFEVIIINDGSDDNTLKIIKEFMKKYTNIILINNTNKGVSYSRNIGIKKAQGDYIMFVDADDKLRKNWFDEMKKYISEENDIIYFSQYNLKSYKENVLKYIIGYNVENICIAGPYSKLFKRNLIEENGISFDEKIINGEDMLFNIKALNKANNIKMIRKSFYLYRRYIGQTTKKFDKRIFNSDILFQKNFSNLLEQYNISDNEKDKLRIFCLQSAVLMLYERISYIKKFSDANIFISKLYNLPYKTVHNKCLLTSKSSKIKYFLYQIKFRHSLYYLLRIIRRIKFNKSREEYISI